MNNSVRWFGLIVNTVLVTSASAGDWMQFRGPGGLGISDEKSPPLTWSEKENLRWKVALPGRGVASPVIAKGRVYVTACTDYQQTRLHVLCFDVKTGKKLWQRQIWATGSTQCHRVTNMAAPTPVTDGDHVYALFASWDLVAFDKEGHLLWYRSLSKDYPTLSNNLGMASSPVLYKNVLILHLENAGESFGLGVDKMTGENLWKTPRHRDINWVSPIIIEQHGRPEVLLQGRTDISAYDPITGKKYWTYKAGLASAPSPVAGMGLIFCPGGGVQAIRVPPGKSEAELVWQSNKLASGYSSPIYYRGRVYAINKVGVVTCADAKTGDVVWRSPRLKGPFSSSPIACDGKLYFVSEKGVTSVLQVGDPPKVLAVNNTPGNTLSSPAIADGALFIRSDEYLYCIEEKK